MHIRANRGSKSAGVDGKTRVTVEKQGVGKFLTEIHKQLKERTYRPDRVREKFQELFVDRFRGWPWPIHHFFERARKSSLVAGLDKASQLAIRQQLGRAA